MKNLVEIYDKNNKKIFSNYNNLHPEFLKGISNLLYNGSIYNTFSIHDNSSSSISLNVAYSLSSQLTSNFNFLTANNTAGIYAFPNENDAYTSFGSTSTITNLIKYPVSVLDIFGNKTYSISSLDSYSFILNQAFHYSPTSNNEFVALKLTSFSIKTNYASSSANIAYFPVAYIISPSNTIYPSELFKISWKINFKGSDNLDDTLFSDIPVVDISNPNQITGGKARLHDTLLSTFKNVLTNVNYDFSASGYPQIGMNYSLENFKITNIVAYDTPNIAIENVGTTGSPGSAGNSFLLTSSITGLTKNNDYTVVYKNKYTNTTTNVQKIGSLLLCGSMNTNGDYKNVRAVLPISWINSIDIWGQNIKLLNPNDSINISWVLDFSPQTTYIRPQDPPRPL